MAKIISCFQNKGGSLKTTLAVNLAVMFAKENNRVLLIDFDAQSNVSMTFGLNPFEIEKSSYDFLLEDNYPMDTLYKPMKNLDILFSNKDLNNLDFVIYSDIQNYKQPFHLLREKLKQHMADYDFIILDTPPSFNLASINSLVTSDYVLVPLVPEVYSVQGLLNIIETIDNIKKTQNNSLEILGIVNVLVSSNTTLHKDMMAQLDNFAGIKELNVFDTFISRSINTASTAAYESKPIMLTNQKNKTTEEYRTFFAELKSLLKEKEGK